MGVAQRAPKKEMGLLAQTEAGKDPIENVFRSGFATDFGELMQGIAQVCDQQFRTGHRIMTALESLDTGLKEMSLPTSETKGISPNLTGSLPYLKKQFAGQFFHSIRGDRAEL